MNRLTRVIWILGVVCAFAGATHANWAESLNDGALDLTTWQFPAFPQVTGTFTQTVKPGADGNHYLAFEETSSVAVGGAAFGAGFPENGLFIQSDIAEPSQLEAIFERTKGFTDTLDALINNAAYQVTKPLLETTVEEWDAVMASNLRSVFLGAKLAYPLLKARGGGAVVNVV